MMKKVSLIILLFISLIAFNSFGQRGDRDRPLGGPGGGERVKAVKIGMITEELQLSEAQAEKFWPVYNAYSEERMAIHRQIRGKMRNSANAEVSDEEILKKQDDILALKEKELDLVKQYRSGFLKIISTKQYAALLETEGKFNQMLMDKLKEKGKN